MLVPLRRRDFISRAGVGSLSLALGSVLTACGRRSPPPLTTDGRTDFAAPFAIAAGTGLRPLWLPERGGEIVSPSLLHLPRGANALGPWITSTAAARFQVRTGSTGPMRVTAEWGDPAHQPLSPMDTWTAQGDTVHEITTPTNAGGFRLRVAAESGDTTVTALSLILTDGIRVEPFPDYAIAGFAFSYDWESAMGGLIHTRSLASSEGAGTQISLLADGGPDVAEAEAKGMRMRDGARFLAAQFAQYGIHATFYTTGYNLLTGNPSRELFLGNPLYPDADLAHGWGSDWWRTHPWYGNDPYGTEAANPAWYFASLTRELAGAGHEIASHTFGHLYVRGVTPEQLDADLQQWQQSADALGITTAPSFAFPWTSSNSLDERFWAVFARRGWTTLTRLYPRDLRHPYELDGIAGDPRLTIFPDFYLPSKSGMADEALARVEETLARRGYHSVWTHPNEAVEQAGQTMWTAVIAGVTAARNRGLWVAPVTAIAAYAHATRQLVVQATDGGRRIAIENGGEHPLNGVTLTLPQRVGEVMVDGHPSRDVRGDQVRLPVLAPGARVSIQVAPV